MNPATESVASAVLVPQPHRSSTSCDRHQDERFTGFCPSCLFERLSVLDQNNNNKNEGSSSRKPPISAASIKAIFKPSSSGSSAFSSTNSNNSRIRPGLFSELRRTKSFSASKNEGFSGVFEPQRRSCDVRVRSTLWTLFSQDEKRNTRNKEPIGGGGGSGEAGSEIEIEPRKSSVKEPVFESKEEGKTESESEMEHISVNSGGDFEIVNESSDEIEERVEDIVEEEEEEKKEIREEDLKPMKEHIDLDFQSRKPSLRDFAGSFWSAASVFSKKLQKWRQKQKLKKRRNGGGSAKLPVEKTIGRQFRDTQSEIADYGFGRRSCDTDPRFSLDAGRFSLDAGRFSVEMSRFSADDPRYSFDEPRASWDGYLRTAFPPARIPPPPSMLSVVEDAPVHHHIPRSDMQIPVEEPPPPANASGEHESIIPGGSSQTRDYYTDSSSRRRKSLDRLSSISKTTVAVVAEMEELNPVSNAKVSPAITVDSYPNSVRDDCSVDTFETGSRDNASVIGNGERKVNNNNHTNNTSNTKKSRWSKWSILGFIHRKSVSKYEEEEDDHNRFGRWNGVMERCISESWPERNGGFINNNNNSKNPKMLRSKSNVSWRNSNGFGGTTRKNGVLERNRSSRYSPKVGENGMLRFHLTPMRGSWNGGSRSGGWEKTADPANNHGHPIARSLMRLY